MGGARRGYMVAFSPLVFGLAHVHHAWETYNRYGRTQDALKRACFSALFQTTYTTFFGAHASFLFLRTSSLLPPFSAHVFCNIMGFPDVNADMARFPLHEEDEWCFSFLPLCLGSCYIHIMVAFDAILSYFPLVQFRNLTSLFPQRSPLPTSSALSSSSARYCR
ncbi:hypothetical protein C8R43DRAFT_1031504 [Mycena crocata]|nr:hypothetical protein C8R43DRAFT_1031504 [Mycena crocata]